MQTWLKYEVIEVNMHMVEIWGYSRRQYARQAKVFLHRNCGMFNDNQEDLGVMMEEGRCRDSFDYKRHD